MLMPSSSSHRGAREVSVKKPFEAQVTNSPLALATRPTFTKVK